VSAATLTRTPTAEENDAVVQALLAERDPFFAMLLDRVAADYACEQCGRSNGLTEANGSTAARTAQS
jgi:hypothetical protein